MCKRESDCAGWRWSTLGPLGSTLEVHGFHGRVGCPTGVGRYMLVLGWQSEGAKSCLLISEVS